MPSELLLPLFPLEVVLLPRATLPLHIFEERYKLMIGEAIAQRSEFGVVLSKDQSLVRSGCTATVERVLKRYPDGRLDILTVGRRRFEILFLDEQKPYLQAGVHYFDDDTDTAAPPEEARRLADLFGRVVGSLPDQAEAAGIRPDADSFQIAGALPLDLEVKQQLLNSRSEAERVVLLREHLQKLAPRLERARRVERASRGNGQGV